MTCRHLYFPSEQRPIVCQLGGSNPEKLAAAARIAAGYGYDEINLNCGCPSDRVAGAGCFGASLMLQPEAVGDGCRAMEEATGTEVTVKCRLGTAIPATFLHDAMMTPLLWRCQACQKDAVQLMWLHAWTMLPDQHRSASKIKEHMLARQEWMMLTHTRSCATSSGRCQSARA